MAIRLRLFAKYATLITVLVGGALIASGAVSLYFAYGESKLALFALQREKADAAAYRIEQYVRGIEHELGWTALPRVQEGSSASEQRRIEFLKLLRQAKSRCACRAWRWMHWRPRPTSRATRVWSAPKMAAPTSAR